MVHVTALGSRDELDHLAGVERAVDGCEGGRLRDPLLDDRLGHFAKCVTDVVDAVEILRHGGGFARDLGLDPVGAFVVDEPALEEPRQRVESRLGSFSTGKPFSVSAVFRKSKVASRSTPCA